MDAPETPAGAWQTGTEDPLVALAASERRTAPESAAEAADRSDTYDRMLHLAALLDGSGEQLRTMASAGRRVLDDPDLVETEPLAPRTYQQAADDVRDATSGGRGLLGRSIELDADALALRATVLTYRWIDDLQDAARRSVGSIAARAIGYLAPEVALGGAVVSAGLIETDALDRDGVAAYLGELAEANPELLDHVTSGGGGLLDGLRMRALLTASGLAGDDAGQAATGGLRATGATAFDTGFAASLRDVAGGLVDADDDDEEDDLPDASDEAGPPRSLTDLMVSLDAVTGPVLVRRVSPHRYIAWLPGPGAGRPGRRLRLVGGDQTSYAVRVVRALERAVADDPEARVMLVGTAQGGVTAAELAASPQARTGRFVVDQVVTAGAPSAHVPRVPEPTRVLSLESRDDPVALLGSLVNAGVPNRVTVVVDPDGASTPEADTAGTEPTPFATLGARAADRAEHPELVAEIERLHVLGYLAG